MLFYTGFGLLAAGIIVLLFGGKFISDAEKLAKARKQAPILSVIGGGLLVVRFLLG